MRVAAITKRWIAVTAVVVLATSGAWAFPDGEPESIETVAGGGTEGDGGPATDASLTSPAGVAIDASGNLFIADGVAGVRRVDSVTGEITTVVTDTAYAVAIDAAGNLFFTDGYAGVQSLDAATGAVLWVAGSGYFGYSGDGGPAVLADLADPSGLAVDPAGNVYVSERGNLVVRRIDAATGVISTFAGGGGQLVDPIGLACDAAGNVFIADDSGVFRVNADTGVMTLAAGQGEGGDGGPAIGASLGSPTGVAVDAAGNLFIAEQGSHRVRRVDAATGIISTVAGNGSAGFDGDGGPATEASLRDVYGVGVDAEGRVYVADWGNRRIRRVLPPNGLPSADAGADQVIEAGSGGVASVQLDGSGSSDPDGHEFSYLWTGSFGDANGEMPTVVLGLGDHTITLSVTDGYDGAEDTVVVHVVDTTGPAIAAAPDVDALATSTDGAIVAFSSPTASDLVDGAVAVTCAPASGALFEVGETTVVCTATDEHGNASTGEFTVTVLIDPRFLKGAVAERLNDLIPTGDRKVDKKLIAAIKDIQDSLAPDLWVDGCHLTEKGRRVFKEELEAVRILEGLVSVSPVVGEAIASLVAADRALAETALSDAVAGGGTAAKVALAQSEVALGVTASEEGRARAAILHFRKCWKHSMQALGLL